MTVVMEESKHGTVNPRQTYLKRPDVYEIRQKTVKKLEFLNPKSETNLNDQKKAMFQTRKIGFVVWSFFRFLVLAAVCFGFRDSDFGFVSMAPMFVETDLLNNYCVRIQ